MGHPVLSLFSSSSLILLLPKTKPRLIMKYLSTALGLVALPWTTQAARQPYDVRKIIQAFREPHDDLKLLCAHRGLR